MWLKKGGYICIDHTEALVAIDVNTGRFTGKKNQEETILRTNLEAAREIAAPAAAARHRRHHRHRLHRHGDRGQQARRAGRAAHPAAPGPGPHPRLRGVATWGWWR